MHTRLSYTHHHRPLLVQIFPSRDRRNIKNKFTKEERQNPQKVMWCRATYQLSYSAISATYKASLQGGNF